VVLETSGSLGEPIERAADFRERRRSRGGSAIDERLQVASADLRRALDQVNADQSYLRNRGAQVP
jgi:hypothetical protein